MSRTKSDVLLGILFFGTLIALGVVTIVLSDFTFGVKHYPLTLLSDDVGYLRPGDPVLLHGMASGKVESIERLPTPRMEDIPSLTPGGRPQQVRCTVRIHARMDVDVFKFLRRDFHVQIEERGLLGGKLIRIEAGTADEPAPPSEELVAKASRTALQAAGTILEENRQNIRTTIDSLASLTEGVNEGKGTLGRLLKDESLADQAQSVLDDLSELSDRLVQGRGTLGRLFTEEGMYDDARAFVSDLRSFSERVKRGEGTVGKLLQEDEVYEDVRGLVADGRSVVSDLKAGQGTLGKLLNETALYDTWRTTGDNLSAITADARAGKGTVGRLLTDDELYGNVNAFFASAKDLSHDLTEGHGLLAALVNDEQLAEDFKSIVAQALGAIEDARETTPVTSLGSFLFGTF